MKAGGWSDFISPISGDEKKIFDKVMEHWVGVKYTPIAAATQVVSGTNYCFICLAKTVVPEAMVTVAKVLVYAPLSGDPHITGIEHLAP